MSNQAVSEIQLEIFNFICRHIAKHGYSPSVREIREGVGPLSTSTIHCHLVELERKKWITRKPNQPRTISVVAAA